MIDILTAQRTIDLTKPAEVLETGLRAFFNRKYVTRRTSAGGTSLNAETNDLVDTTARFVGRMDGDFRGALEKALREKFPVTADQRQKAMGLSYVVADLDDLVALVISTAKPSAPTDPTTEARAAAAAAVEQLLCGTRIIRKISDALGFDDPEGVAAKVNTETLQLVIADLIVAEIKRAKDR
ncbi:MAG: hypothetical protein DI537_10375 [Stutzerimonas stutzeri]|nr:MAG: hypothetical protein DI537_10375 [Stutzerimonas stutzeri]